MKYTKQRLNDVTSRATLTVLQVARADQRALLLRAVELADAQLRVPARTRALSAGAPRACPLAAMLAPGVVRVTHISSLLFSTGYQDS